MNLPSDDEHASNWRQYGWIPLTISLLLIPVAAYFYLEYQTRELHKQYESAFQSSGTLTDNNDRYEMNEEESPAPQLILIDENEPKLATLRKQEPEPLSKEGVVHDINNETLNNDESAAVAMVSEDEPGSVSMDEDVSIAQVEELRQEQEPVHDTESERPLEVAEEQLAGLNNMYQIDQLVETYHSEQELVILQRQLEWLPPEAAFQPGSSSPDDACKLCWSIVYRPLINPESL